MKYAYSLLLYNIFFSCCFMNAMEDGGIPLEPLYKEKSKTQSMQSSTDIVERIDKEIYRHLPPNSRSSIEVYLGFVDYVLPKDNITPVFYCVQQYSDNLNDEVINKLQKKNTVFEKAMNYCIDFAYNDLQNVTCDTLHNIENRIMPHPTLSTLIPTIKDYVMKKAHKKVDCHYTMVLEGHAAPISCFEQLRQIYAGTVDKDNILKIWDLTKRLCLHTIKRDLVVKSITFNDSGSCFATLEDEKIIIWDREQGIEKVVIKSVPWLDSISYFEKARFLHFSDIGHESDRDTLMATGFHNGQTYAGLLWDVDKDHVNFQGAQGLLLYKKAYMSGTRKNDRGMTILSERICNNRKNLILTMNSMQWYLCNQAIKNTKKVESLEKVGTSQSYEKLTEYEKEMVDKEVTERCNALVALKQQEESSAQKKTIVSTLWGAEAVSYI